MIQQLTQVFAVALAVLALKLGVALFGGADQYTFAFIVLAVLVLSAFVGSIRLPQKAGDSIRVRGSGG